MMLLIGLTMIQKTSASPILQHISTHLENLVLDHGQVLFSLGHDVARWHGAKHLAIYQNCAAGVHLFRVTMNVDTILGESWHHDCEVYLNDIKIYVTEQRLSRDARWDCSTAIGILNEVDKQIVEENNRMNEN